jgi:hypothetical protein
MSDTPTPETDKAEDSDPMVEGEWHWIVPSSFARRLERERDEARKDLVALEELHRRRFGTLRKELAASNRGAKINAHINNSLCSKVIQAERERDEAREELAEIKSCIAQGIDFYQVHGRSVQAFALKNLLQNINERLSMSDYKITHEQDNLR